ncbi:MAG: hypothetical protein IT258_23840 [Saprospiraceae bacterium]|nr:hypothetical protein [Saprospiraceae bacterium]
MDLVPVPVPVVAAATPTLPISEPATKNPLPNAVAGIMVKASTNGVANGAQYN